MSEIPWTSGRILMRDAIFSGYIENTGPLRIGAGKQQSLTSITDLPVIRVYLRDFEVPYIPGSSIKGSFRSTAIALAQVKGLKVCNGLPRENCMDMTEMSDVANRLKLGKSDEAMKEFFKKACILCKIFGAPSYVGKVFFEDAYPIDEDGNLIDFRVGRRVGIAIDRRTGAVYPRALYDVEFIEPGTRFRFKIRCRNLPNYALGLLAAILKLLHAGEVKLGGFKTRGFGQVKLEDLVISVRDFGEKNEKLRLRAIEEGVDMEVDVSDVAEIHNGWLVASGDDAWKLLDRLQQVWWNVKL